VHDTWPIGNKMNHMQQSNTCSVLLDHDITNGYTVDCIRELQSSLAGSGHINLVDV